jgi:hypothetical protein
VTGAKIHGSDGLGVGTMTGIMIFGISSGFGLRSWKDSTGRAIEIGGIPINGPVDDRGPIWSRNPRIEKRTASMFYLRKEARV